MLNDLEWTLAGNDSGWSTRCTARSSPKRRRPSPSTSNRAMRERCTSSINAAHASDTPRVRLVVRRDPYRRYQRGRHQRAPGLGGHVRRLRIRTPTLGSLIGDRHDTRTRSMGRTGHRDPRAGRGVHDADRRRPCDGGARTDHIGRVRCGCGGPCPWLAPGSGTSLPSLRRSFRTRLRRRSRRCSTRQWRTASSAGYGGGGRGRLGKLGRGRGRGPQGDALTSDSRLHTASVGKTVTAAQILRLVEDGKLGLDDPAADHFPRSWHPSTRTAPPSETCWGCAAASMTRTTGYSSMRDPPPPKCWSERRVRSHRPGPNRLREHQLHPARDDHRAHHGPFAVAGHAHRRPGPSRP